VIGCGSASGPFGAINLHRLVAGGKQAFAASDRADGGTGAFGHLGWRENMGQDTRGAAALAILTTMTVVATVSAPHQALAQGRSIHVVEQATNSSYVAIGTLFGNTSPAGAQGDYLVWDDPVFDPRTNTQVGQSMGQCTLVSVTPQVFSCFVEVTLNGRGNIAFQGALGPTGTIGQSVVTGGTGEFLGSVGYATLKILNGGATDDWIVTLY
jgi:hypothetical protein